MANVNIKFNNKDYILSCEDDQEDNLKELAKHLDSKYEELKKKLGNIGENKLLLITSIKIVDEYFDLFKKVKHNKGDFEKLSIKFKELRSLAINYKEDKEYGQGTFTSPDEEQYAGESKNRGEHKGAISTMTYTVAGLKYVGEWENGKPHGQGTLTSPEGTPKKGIWRNGEPISDVCKDKGLGPKAYRRCILKLID